MTVFYHINDYLSSLQSILKRYGQNNVFYIILIMETMTGRRCMMRRCMKVLQGRTMMMKEICGGDNGIRIVSMRDPRFERSNTGDCEIAVVDDGIMSLRIADRTFTLRKGRVYLLRSSDDATLTTICSGRVTALRFPEKLAEKVFDGYALCSPVLEGDTNEVAAALSCIRGELENKKYGYEIAAEMQIKQCLLNICRTQKLCNPAVVYSDMASGFFGNLLADIDKKYADYTFDDAARFMRLSRAYFSVVFHKHMGTTFSQYLNYIRVRSAVDMLKSDSKASITDVSLRCGFNTIRNFNRAFRGITGYSPRSMPKDYVLAPLE